VFLETKRHSNRSNVTITSGSFLQFSRDYERTKVFGFCDRVHWMASVHMHSNRTVSARCVNSQGAMNEHTGDGVVYSYYDGSEYNRAFESWDWRRLPGITADVASPMLPCNYSAQLQNDSEYMRLTGTVSDGREGMSAMSLRSHNVLALKVFIMSCLSVSMRKMYVRKFAPLSPNFNQNTT
jgi:hypothetical protein